MADKEVKIDIKTKADTRGVKQAEKATHKLEETLLESIYTLEDKHEWMRKKNEEEEEAIRLAKNEEERENIHSD